MRSQLRTSLLAVGFSAVASITIAPSALADITVGPAGSGAQTDSLNDAIFNADEDETIFVYAGHYPNIRVIGKSVRIIGEGADLVTISGVTPETFGQSNRIDDLGPDQKAFFSGVTFDMEALSGLNSPLVLASNRGSVFFHDCGFQSNTTAGQACVSAFFCDNVTFDQCEFAGYQPEIQADPISVGGGGCLYAETSYLRFNACVMEAGDALQSGLFFSEGGLGLSLRSCTAVLHNTSVHGGDAQISGASSVGAGVGIQAENSTVVVTGATGTTITGGNGGSEDPLSIMAGAPAVRFVESLGIPGILGSLTHSQTVTLMGGTGSDGTPAPATDLGGSLATVELFQRPGLTPSVASGAPGSSFAMNFDGEPGSACLLALALETVAPYEFVDVAGQALLDPVGADLFGLVTLNGNGEGSLTVDVPAMPALVGTSGFFQCLQSGAAGGSFLSLPTGFMITQ